MDKPSTIKELRELTSLSQKAFADKYGVSRRNVEDWERGLRNIPPYRFEALMAQVMADTMPEIDAETKAEEDAGEMMWYKYDEHLSMSLRTGVDGVPELVFRGSIPEDLQAAYEYAAKHGTMTGFVGSEDAFLAGSAALQSGSELDGKSAEEVLSEEAARIDALGLTGLYPDNPAELRKTVQYKLNLYSKHFRKDAHAASIEELAEMRRKYGVWQAKGQAKIKRESEKDDLNKLKRSYQAVFDDCFGERVGTVSIDKDFKVVLKIQGWDARVACEELEPSDKCTVKYYDDGDLSAWRKEIRFTAKNLKEFKKALSL